MKNRYLRGKRKMEEILVCGSILEDLARLGIKADGVYISATSNYSVYQLSNEDFDILYNDKDAEENYKDGGWRWCEGSNQGEPNATLIVNNKKLRCWAEHVEDEEAEEPYYRDYLNLREYLSEEKGCSSFKNVCALAKDLAKYNDMTMAALFHKYQG
jgi:hypothetical protein